MIELSNAGKAGWLIARIRELASGLGAMSIDEMRSSSRALMESRRRGGHDSPELIASGLALACAALQRTTGASPDDRAVASSVYALASVAGRSSSSDARTTQFLALYWHGLAGLGVHCVARDDAHARSVRDFFGPAGEVLDCSVGVVADRMPDTDRRTAYSAAITVGSWAELAIDYLRDNLQTSASDTVQRRLYAAVVDDSDGALVGHALTSIHVSAPRVDFEPSDAEITTLARRFRRKRDYHIDRAGARMFFTDAGMSRLKSLLRWGAQPSLDVATRAERVEAAIAVREGVDRSDGYQTLAEIALQGYLNTYPTMTYLSSAVRTFGIFEEALIDSIKDDWHCSQLAFERLIDKHRAGLYAFRSAVRDEVDSLSVVPLFADGAVRHWLSGGPEALRSGLRGVLGRHATEDAIDSVVAGGASDVPRRAALLIREATERRTERLGEPLMEALVQSVVVQVIDVEWRRHLARLQILRQQGDALYAPDNKIEARAADVLALFTACEQNIRVDSLKYALELDPELDP